METKNFLEEVAEEHFIWKRKWDCNNVFGTDLQAGLQQARKTLL